jgi:hypothetical protein
MAAPQEMILKLLFNDDGTFVGLEEINKELKKVDDSTTKVEETTKGLKQQYAELRKEQDKYDPGTEKFNELSIKMGELKDRMNDAADAVRGNTGPAIEGARASFGLLGEQLLNLDFEGVSQSLNLVSGNLARLKPEDLSKGFKSMADAGVNAFKAIGKAILANPYLAVAAALVAIAMNFDKIIKLFPDLEAAMYGIDNYQRSVTKNAQLNAEAAKKNYDNALLLENSLRLQGKSEKEILQYKMGELEAAIKNAEVSLATQEQTAQAQIDASVRNRQILEGIIRWINAPLYLLLATIDKIAAAVGQSSNLAEGLVDLAAELVVSPAEQEKQLKESFDAQRTQLAQMKNDYAGFQLSIKKIDDDAAKSKADLAAKELDEYNKSQEEITAILAKWEEERLAMEAELAAYQKTAREDRLNDEERIAEEIYQASLSAQQKEINEVRNKYFELITLAEFYGEDATSLKEAQAKAEAEIVKKYAEEEAKANEEKNKKILEDERAVHDAKIGAASKGIASLIALNESFTARTQKTAKRQFELNKALSIAAAIIDTYAAINSALKDPSPIPTSVKIAQAVAVGVMGFANVAKIAKTQFGGTTPDTSMNQGGNADSTTQANAPAIDFSGGQFNPNGPGTVETYVLAGNVANALEARQKIIDQSYL